MIPMNPRASEPTALANFSVPISPISGYHLFNPMSKIPLFTGPRLLVFEPYPPLQLAFGAPELEGAADLASGGYNLASGGYSSIDHQILATHTIFGVFVLRDDRSARVRVLYVSRCPARHLCLRISTLVSADEGYFTLCNTALSRCESRLWAPVVKFDSSKAHVYFFNRHTLELLTGRPENH